MKMTTNMKGFQRWMREHPRKRVDGYFFIGDRALTHNEIKRIVDYAVEKGYRRDVDIPSDELEKLIKETEK